MPMYPIGNGKFVEVDEEDVVAMSFHQWCLCGGYPVTMIKWKRIYLHIFIMKRMGKIIPKGMEIDHKDRNINNYKRNNLRIVTRSQNQMNKKISKSNILGIKNIYYREDERRYEVRIMANNEYVFRKNFKTLDEAIKERDKALLKYHGEYALFE